MKKGAVAGAIVWSAPLLTSTPAFAASGRCTGSKVCTQYYYFKRDSSECSPGSPVGVDPSCATPFPLESVKCNTSDLTPTLLAAPCDGPNGVSAGWSGQDNVNISVSLPVGAIPVFIRIKAGNDCSVYQFSDPVNPCSASQSPLTRVGGPDIGGVTACLTSSANGVTVTINRSDIPNGSGTSHIAMVYCL